MPNHDYPGMIFRWSDSRLSFDSAKFDTAFGIPGVVLPTCRFKLWRRQPHDRVSWHGMKTVFSTLPGLMLDPLPTPCARCSKSRPVFVRYCTSRREDALTRGGRWMRFRGCNPGPPCALDNRTFANGCKTTGRTGVAAPLVQERQALLSNRPLTPVHFSIRDRTFESTWPYDRRPRPVSPL
jgi:hypothetical protein